VVFDLRGRGRKSVVQDLSETLATRRCGRRDGGGWGWATRPASQSYRVEPGRVRSGDHPQMRLAFRRCLLTSWWHMQIEDLIFEDDVRGYFENGSDLDAFIVAGVDDGDVYYGCAVNPDIDPGREFDALGWCARLVTRIEDLGFDEAMKADAWQHRSDGRWQLWDRE